MKLLYDNNLYDCSWKSKMKTDYWYNMAIVKVKARMPIQKYKKIILDIRIKNEEIQSGLKRGTENEFDFSILINDGEFIHWLGRDSESVELWKFNSFLERISYTSQFNDGTVVVNFDLLIKEQSLCDKSQLREVLLNQLV